MTIGTWLYDAQVALAQSGCADPRADSEWLLCEATGHARSSLRHRAGEALGGEALLKLNDWLKRRLTGEPLQYVLGSAYFMGLPFKCDERALIPRPETELLTDLAITLLRERGGGQVLDMCCGTGCIGLSVAHFVSAARVTLADISPEALSLARENAALLHCDAAFVQSDLFGNVAGQFDMILCNPPYLTADDMAHLQAEVRREPALALFGGQDGLTFYRRMAHEAPNHLREGGAILLELGMGQAEDIQSLFTGWGGASLYSDYNGVPRVALITGGMRHGG